MASKGKRRFQAPHTPQAPRARQFEDLQNQMAQAQSALEQEVVTASVGGGAVTIEMSGTQALKSIKIKPEVLNPEDAEMLEDMLMAAFQEATEKAQQLTSQRLGPLAGGLDLGGLL